MTTRNTRKYRPAFSRSTQRQINARIISYLSEHDRVSDDDIIKAIPNEKTARNLTIMKKRNIIATNSDNNTIYLVENNTPPMFRTIQL